jgi:hypothetical protein
MLALALLAAVVTSAAPSAVTVGIYRAPYRSADQAWNLEWLEGYALVTEERRVAVPAGESVIRFEGVAGGILPESAIVTGLPEGAREKNQDAALLTPATLAAGSMVRRVTIRRTDRATGKVTESDALLRAAGAGGGSFVIESKEGVEAVSCSGLSEATLFPGLPEGLTAKPTLSVTTRTSRATEVVLKLSYLAANFDWQANYVGQLNDDATRLDLFGWVTVASADPTSFDRARLLAIAGKPNRESGDGPALSRRQEPYLTCWNNQTTTSGLRAPPPPPPPPPPAPMEAARAVSVMSAEDEASIVVTGSLMRQENLGDLKLYRMPEPVTVAARSQKQVAFLNRTSLPVELIYRTRIGEDDEGAVLLLRGRNREQDGLGLPLPAGKVAVFQHALLVGEAALTDKAVGEDVDLKLSNAEAVSVNSDYDREGKGWRAMTLTVTNPHPHPIRYEAEFPPDDDDCRYHRFDAKLERRKGVRTWSVTIPANGEARLRYRREEL